MKKTRFNLIAAVLFLLAGAFSASAQKYEVGISLGGMITSDRTIQFPPGSIDIKASLTALVNFSTRLANFKAASLHLEFPFAGAGNTNLTSSNPLLPRNYSSIFFSPGIKLKFLPGRRVSPYAAIGGGFARFDESGTLLNGQPNPGSKGKTRGVLDYGGGLDFRLLKFLALRGEIRDFVSGSPSFNFPVTGKQHNILTSAGVVFRL